jgi:hypothetical protein
MAVEEATSQKFGLAACASHCRINLTQHLKRVCLKIPHCMFPALKSDSESPAHFLNNRLNILNSTFELVQLF